MWLFLHEQEIEIVSRFVSLFSCNVVQIKKNYPIPQWQATHIWDSVTVHLDFSVWPTFRKVETFGMNEHSVGAILHNTLLATFIKLLETDSKGLFRSRSQNCCHTYLVCRHICKTCAFHDALQAGKQKEVHHTPLIGRRRAIPKAAFAEFPEAF
jgi:hypothetical protein